MADQHELDRREAFVRVFAQNDRWLYAYLMTLLGSPLDAEEVYQEVCVVLWRDYEKFDPTTNFKKWASVIARYRVLQYRDSENRRAARLSAKAVELIADDAVEQAEMFDERRVALHACLEKLSDSDRELVSACYSDVQSSFRDVAEQLGRPANTVYKGIQRIRRALRDCIERRMTTSS